MDAIDFIQHLDTYLAVIANQHGVLTYALLFFIIFAETGLVLTAFLPGESLVFTIGALSAINVLRIWITYPLLFIAAFLGNCLNYWIGKKIGPQVFEQKKSKLFNKASLAKTENFYKKHGGKTIIIARFLPVIKTFAPLIAGIGHMHYKTFIIYNLIGSFIWVTFYLLLGYLFGGVEIIKNNFAKIFIGIVTLSLISISIIRLMRNHATKKPSQSNAHDIDRPLSK